MKTHHALCGLISGLLLLAAGTLTVHGQYAYFNDPTDTIRANGNTTLGTAATYEALVLLSTASFGGIIFNEWANALEDNYLAVDSTSITGFSYNINPADVSATVALTLNQWHHIAYVYDGSQERIYLDGVLAGSHAASGSILNSNTGAPFVGAIFRGGTTHASFQGYIDTLRISNNARYSGASFTAPTGDLTTDANTQLLYNFDDAPGSPTAVDSSANGFTGTLGTGFAGATTPLFVSATPEPASAALLLGSGAMLLPRRRRAAAR